MTINQLLFGRYNTEWYETSLFTQKVILFILQRGTKNFRIVFGKLLMASMESVTMVRSKSLNEILPSRKSPYNIGMK
jgi:hypothetical protein